MTSGVPFPLLEASPLYENENLKEGSIPTVTPIEQVRDEGNARTMRTQHLLDAAWNPDRILRSVLKAEWQQGALKGLEIWLGCHVWKCLRRMRLRLCM